MNGIYIGNDVIKFVFYFWYLCVDYCLDNKSIIGGVSMPSNEYISIPIDSTLKIESDCILADIGLSTQTVVSMLLRTIVRNKAIPKELFTIDSRAANNAAYLAKLDRSFAEYRKGLGKTHALLEVPNE